MDSHQPSKFPAESTLASSFNVPVKMVLSAAILRISRNLRWSCVLQVADLSSKISELDTGFNRHQYEASEHKVGMCRELRMMNRANRYSHIVIIGLFHMLTECQHS